MTDPWDRPRTRLAIYMAPKRHGAQTALGWTVFELQHPPQIAGGEDRVEGSPLDTILRRYRALQAQHPGAAGITLYRYGPATFAASRAAREGLTHHEHNRMIDDVAHALRAEGIDVVILPA